MDSNLKSTSIPQSQQKGKTPTLRVQTGLRAGRGLLSRINAWFQDLTAGMTDEQRAEAADDML
jgi:hypothetical protein